MVSSNKRRTDDEHDFILTLSDDENDLVTEELKFTSKSSKKRKLDAFNQPQEFKNLKAFISTNGPRDKGFSENDDDEGIWGTQDEDDDAMDPEFEFESQLVDGNQGGFEVFEGWDFDSAKKNLVGNKKVTEGRNGTVDLNQIIDRRKSQRDKDLNEENLDKDHDSEYDAEINALNSGDEGDEFLAEDGFGMGADSEDEGSGDEAVSESDDGEENLDNSNKNSIDGPSSIPDQTDSDEEQGDSDISDDVDEKARKEAFFAPEEKLDHGKKTTVIKSFQDLSLSRPILRGLASVGFTNPTPIQVKTIPIALLGKDIVGGAVTGSGKTAAFIVPILERLLHRPKKVPTSRVTILVPTRELAIQCYAVATRLASHTDIKFCLAVGGLSLKAQEIELRLRPDVIIGTPGRFIDHMRNSVSFTVESLEILVLDEADRMLEAGFSDELNEILTTIPKSRQTMLFSATMTSSIDHLIRVGLNKPVRLQVDAQKQTVSTLIQEFIRLRPGREMKRIGYLLFLCRNVYTHRTIIFFKQKKEAHRARIIFGFFGLKSAELHGSMSQEQRILSVEAFRDGKVAFLLATDLASRGLDIKGIDTVINYEAPQSHEIYLHRVGRTARAGRQGRACTLAAEPDRKIVKAAVKSARSQGAKIVSRVIEAPTADELFNQVKELEGEIEEVLKEEKEEKQLAQLEMQVQKGQNMVKHEDEIKGRPKRTWFESQREKKLMQKAGRLELNRQETKQTKKIGKLSNKKKKMLNDKDARVEGKIWKKGRAEREGKGAIASKKDGKSKKGKNSYSGTEISKPQRRGSKR